MLQIYFLAAYWAHTISMDQCCAHSTQTSMLKVKLSRQDRKSQCLWLHQNHWSGLNLCLLLPAQNHMPAMLSHNALKRCKHSKIG